ncbi:MAG: hypothetical protein Q9209_000918 [Squamulea sp. 1 TL-2023]
MAPSTLKFSCACRRITGTIDISHSTLPLGIEFCHCSICRHSSGQLAVSCFTCNRASSNDSPTLQITSKEHPVAYKSSEELTRYFCDQCGASIYLDILESGDYEISTGVLDQAEGLLTFKQHIFVESTKDGGLSSWIEGEAWNGWAEKSERFQQPAARGSQSQSLGDRSETLECYCHCRGVEFYVTRPDEESAKVSAPLPDLLTLYHLHSHPPQDQNPNESGNKWWLRANGTKYLAGLCACNSCRLATGYDLQAWAFVPKTNIRQLDGTEIDFSMGTLKTYSHSPGAYREFCGRCGATVFWWHEEREGRIIDISVGLLDAKEGAKAEEWLEWRTKKVSFEECAQNKSLVAKVTEGLRKWGQKEA